MKRHAPAAGRNRDPIAAVLSEELPGAGLVLEIASGTGEHAVHFARTYPHLLWQPSDPDPDARDSIAAWQAEAALPNLLPPLALDVCQTPWPIGEAAALVCVNMVHISPPEASECLLAGAAAILPPGGVLVLYGPYLEADVATAPSNLAFDASLKARDARWGLRPVEWIDDLADANGLTRTRRVAMPANNLTLVYRKESGDQK